MIDSLIQWSLKNRVLVLALAVGLVVWGVRTGTRMPVDVFPDLTAPTVTVVAEAHGMAPEEVERLITFPIESALNGATHVRRVRSSTSIGIAVIWVEFEWSTDIYIARQIVAEKLQLVQPSLPPEITPPILAPISSIMGEILFIGLTSDTVTPRDLRTLADWDIRRRLLAVPGVSQVIPIGGEVQQFQVQVRPHDLLKYDLSLMEVNEAVADANHNVSAGFYEQSGREYLIYGLGRVQDVADLAQAVITQREGVPIRVRDIADVALGSRIKRGDGSINGEPGVILGIQKQPQANTLALTTRIDGVLDDISASLPKGVVLHRDLLRQADFIEAGVNNVNHALRDGAILVVLIVGLFLFSGRATVITALAIPLSLVTAVIILDFLGATLNTMTLGGMAIAVGALVDDAIIDVENVVRRLREASVREQSQARILKIIFAASKEVRSSIVFATLIIMLVFLPLFFLQGVEGRLLRPLGFAYVISLAASLAVALTVTPVLCFFLLPKSRAVVRGLEPKPLKWLRNRYEALLRFTFGHWQPILALTLVLVLAATWFLWRSSRTFLPEFNEGALTISVVTFPGTSLAQSNQIGDLVETILLDQPEVLSTARRTGRAELDEHAQGIHASEIDVRLRLDQRSEAALLQALRRRFEAVPGTNINIGQPISHRIDHMISGTRANIAVKIFGPDLVVLRRLAEAVQAEMAQVRGVVDLAVEDQVAIPFATIRFDRDRIAEYGLRIHDVAEAMETAFYGKVVSRVLSGSYPFDLVVRYPDQARDDLDTVKQTLIEAPGGVWVPLEALADIRLQRGPNQISRENGQRKIVTMCNVGDGAVLGDVVTAIQDRVATDVNLPAGYYIEYGGQFEAAESASRTLLFLSLVVIAGILLLLQVALGSISDALLVMLNLPLALIGGVAGVVFLDGVVSIAVLIGFIALFGIATRNGIMMVTHVHHLLRKEGVNDPREAVVRGASERLAPILMTALASGMGLLPLAMAFGQPGSEIQSPMATVILFGLVSSTFLNMIVLPIMLLKFGALRRMPQTS